MRYDHRRGAYQPAAACRFPLTLELTAPSLPKRSWIKISQIRTLAVERIGKQFGRASPEDLARVADGLLDIIGT